MSDPKPSLDNVLAELEREFYQRRDFYPRQVRTGKMAAATARHRMECIAYAGQLLRWLDAQREGLEKALGVSPPWPEFRGDQ